MNEEFVTNKSEQPDSYPDGFRPSSVVNLEPTSSDNGLELKDALVGGALVTAGVALAVGIGKLKSLVEAKIEEAAEERLEKKKKEKKEKKEEDSSDEDNAEE